jgi:hypothetical protein
MFAGLNGTSDNSKARQDWWTQCYRRSPNTYCNRIAGGSHPTTFVQSAFISSSEVHTTSSEGALADAGVKPVCIVHTLPRRTPHTLRISSTKRILTTELSAQPLEAVAPYDAKRHKPYWQGGDRPTLIGVEARAFAPRHVCHSVKGIKHQSNQTLCAFLLSRKSRTMAASADA